MSVWFTQSRRALGASVIAVIAWFAWSIPAAASAAPAGESSSPAGGESVAQVPPGTVLATRTVSYHMAGVPLPVQVVQLRYRSTGALGQPTTNVTSVLKPPVATGPTRAVSYQSFYDSLNPADEPSAQLAGGMSHGGALFDSESMFIAPLLLQGVTVIVPDTEGQSADLVAGPEYGINTLDSVRAATRSPLTGVGPATRVGMMGYSGGALATDWASQLAPSYAPDVNRQLVGAAEGGVAVDLGHIVRYISGSVAYSGVMPIGIIGAARAYHVDLTPYLSAYDRQLFSSLQHASILDAAGHYPGLTFAKMVKPPYANPDSIPSYVHLINELNMASAASPTIPMLIVQGANGIPEGTSPGPPGIGPGDGVTVTGDVRSLARQFCRSGTAVNYTQYDAGSHLTTAEVWAISARSWLTARFAGAPAPNNCASIAPGNSLAPERQVAHSS